MRKKKSLGQNFLIDHTVARDMADAISVSPSDTVFEIGPGEGALTQELLVRGARVVAVEKDARLIPLLRERFAADIERESLTLIEGDALQETPDACSLPEGYVVAANVPYYISGELLRMLFSQSRLPSRAVLLLQKEVVERIVARGGKESVLSLSVQAYGSPKKVRTVLSGAFRPIPGVDSAILLVENISRSRIAPFEDTFFTLVKAGFSEKRKRLQKNLEKVVAAPAVAHAFEALSIPQDIRAENLSFAEWRTLVQTLAPSIHSTGAA